MAFSSPPVCRYLGGLLWGAVGLAACGHTETVSFEIDVADDACVERASQGAPLDLFLLPMDADGNLCQLRQTTVQSEPSPTVLDVGTSDVDEIVVLARVRSDPQCVRCYGIVRVLLRPELTRYSLVLSPATDCRIPEATLGGLGLPSELLPAPSCRF